MTSMVAPATDNRDDETADNDTSVIVKVPRGIFDAIDVPPWATRRNITTRTYAEGPDDEELFGWFCHDIAVPGGGTVLLEQYVYAETKSADVEVRAATIDTRSIDAMANEENLPSATFAGLAQAFSRAASLAVVADMWARMLPTLDAPTASPTAPDTFPAAPCPPGCRVRNHGPEDYPGEPDVQVVYHDGIDLGDTSDTLLMTWVEERSDRPGVLTRHAGPRIEDDDVEFTSCDLRVQIGQLNTAIAWLESSE